MATKKPPKGDLPADWFCENQTNLLDLLPEEDTHEPEPDADPRRV